MRKSAVAASDHPKGEATRKAIELNETLWLPHQTLGTILTHFHWKWEEGNREYQRARQLKALNETSATAAPVLLREGQFDGAIAERHAIATETCNRSAPGSAWPPLTGMRLSTIVRSTNSAAPSICSRTIRAYISTSASPSC